MICTSGHSGFNVTSVIQKIVCNIYIDLYLYCFQKNRVIGNNSVPKRTVLRSLAQEKFILVEGGLVSESEV